MLPNSRSTRRTQGHSTRRGSTRGGSSSMPSSRGFPPPSTHRSSHTNRERIEQVILQLFQYLDVDHVENDMRREGHHPESLTDTLLYALHHMHRYPELEMAVRSLTSDRGAQSGGSGNLAAQITGTMASGAGRSGGGSRTHGSRTGTRGHRGGSRFATGPSDPRDRMFE